MKRCTYCGKEYSDSFVQCSVDGTVLINEEPPFLPPIIEPPATAPENPVSFSPAVPVMTRAISDRRLRIFELSLVCVVAVGSSLLLAIYSLFEELPNNLGGHLRWLNGVVHEISALALLWYVLLRRSRSFADIGFNRRWSDLGWSLILWFGGGIASGGIYRLIYYSGLTPVAEREVTEHVTHFLFGGGVFIGTLAFQCINPFFEELIVRAYVTTEVRELTNSVWKAVVFSTVLQTSYHLYQGIPMTIAIGAEFFLWSLFYAKTNRITPIILAHLYADVGPTLWHMLRH